MIIVTLTFKKSLPEVFEKLKEHHDFLKQYHDSGKIIASGPTEDKKEGIVLIKSDSIEEAQNLLANDPFYTHDIADYTYKLFKTED